MRSASIIAAIIASGIAGAGCNNAPAANQEFFGPTIEPPLGLAKLKPGMSVTEAKRLVPGLREDHQGVRDHLEIDSKVADVKLQVRIDAGVVANIVAIVSGQSGRALLTKAWGEPEINKDALGQPEVTWSSEATGWKVKLDCLERNCIVEYVPFHVLDAEFFGAHVVPPEPLAQLRIGMKLADARKLAPGHVDVRAGIPTGVDGVRAFVAVDDKRGTLKAIYLNLPAHAAPLIFEAWGPGLAAKAPVGRDVLVWPDPSTGWRATLRDALGSSHDLAFDNYVPAATLFGEQPDVVDGVPVLNLPVEAVKKQFAAEVSTQGRDLVLTLPPTEWERSATKVTLDIMHNRVRALNFAIPFKAFPDARDTLLELFTHKWGEPRPSEEDGKRILIFRDGDPRVEISEDSEHGAWRIEVRR